MIEPPPTALKVAGSVGGRAGGWVAIGGFEGSALSARYALRRPAGGDPVDLARGVVIHRIETETFEPPRGSGAHVSETVPAIHDHRSATIEGARARSGQRLEG